MENEPVLDGQITAMHGQLAERVMFAQADKRALNALLNDYMPFIKKCVSAVFFKADERRSNITEAMFAFIQSVRTYKSENGAFIPYAKVVIHNRLINAARKEIKIKKRFFAAPLFKNESGKDLELETSRRQYEIAEEHKNLRAEILTINMEFDCWGFELIDLVRTCPKQERSRRTCGIIARKTIENRELIADMMKTHTLPIKKISALTGYSEKILEKYRRYIVAVVVIMEGDYPYMRAFLPQFYEEETPVTTILKNGIFLIILFLLERL